MRFSVNTDFVNNRQIFFCIFDGTTLIAYLYFDATLCDDKVHGLKKIFKFLVLRYVVYLILSKFPSSIKGAKSQCLLIKK